MLPIMMGVNMNNLQKEKIKKLYIKGYSATNISNIFNNQIKVGTIKKHIQRNLKNFKEEHEKNKRIIQDCKRAIMNTDKRFMSTKSLVMWNRQSYKTLENGKLIFDKERGLAPVDLPKTYK